MAPSHSLLPLPKGRAPPSGLPLPLSRLPTSHSTRPPLPQQQHPAPPKPARSVGDLSRFDLDALLDSHGDEDDFLADLEQPSWLADQSAFTLGGRTPARKTPRKSLGRLMEVSMGLGEEEGEEEDQIVFATLNDEASLAGDYTEQDPIDENRIPLRPSPSPEPAPLPPSPVRLPSPSAPEVDVEQLEEAVEFVAAVEDAPAPIVHTPPSPLLEPQPTDEALQAEDHPADASFDIPPAHPPPPPQPLHPPRHRLSLGPLPRPARSPTPVELDAQEAVPSRSAAQIEIEEMAEPAAATASRSPSPRIAPDFAAEDPEAVEEPVREVAEVEEVAEEVGEDAEEETGEEQVDAPAAFPEPAPPARPLPPLRHRPSLAPLPLPAAALPPVELEEGAEPRLQAVNHSAIREVEEERSASLEEPALPPPAPLPTASLFATVLPAAPLQPTVPSRPPPGPHSRKSLAPLPKPAALPADPLADRRDSLAPVPVKKRAAEKGVKQLDEEKRKRVREMREERERKARERKEKAAAATQEKGKEKEKRGRASALPPLTKGEKGTQKEVEPAAVAASTADDGEAKTAADPVNEAQALLADLAAPPPADEAVNTPPSPFLPPPALAFDFGDTSLPAMGAPLDFGSPRAVDTAAEGVARGGVTSTPAPARMGKRKAVEVEEPPLPPAEAVDEVEPAPVPAQAKEQERKKARRTTLAVPPLPALDELAESGGVPPAQMQAVKILPRRRPSRVSLAPVAAETTSISLAVPPLLSASTSGSTSLATGKTVRVSLLAPPPPPSAAPAPTPAPQPSAPLSRSHRRASRVSLGPAEPPIASTCTAVRQPTDSASSLISASSTPPNALSRSLSLSLSASTSTSRRRASRVPLEAEVLAPLSAPPIARTAEGKPVPLARSQRRASRVPVETASVEALAPPAQSEHADPTLLRSATHRRPSRVSLAPPPPTPPSRLAVPAEEDEQEQEQQRDEEEDVKPLVKSTARRASRVPGEVEVEKLAAVAPPPAAPTALSRSRPASQPSRLGALSSSFSSHPAHPPIKAPAVPAPVSHLTLPASFAFASSAERNAERERKKEDREKREKRAQEEMWERKRRREEAASAWAVKGKGDEGREEGAKRPKLATAVPASAAPPAPPPVASSISIPPSPPPAPTEEPAPRPRSRLSSSLSASHPHRRPRRSFLDPHTGAEVVVEAVTPAPLALVSEEKSEASPVPLTKAALDSNARQHLRPGSSRGETLHRRVSAFLEGITQSEEGAEEAVEEVALVQEVEEQQDPPALPAAAAVKPKPTTTAPPPPPPARPAPLSPPAAPAKRSAVTTAKPFTFGASRSARPRPAPPSTAETAQSPMFTASLSSWQARERAVAAEKRLAKSGSAATAGSRVRKALASAAPPPPAAKRARVEISSARPPVLAAKENLPSSSSSGAAVEGAKEKERVIGTGGVAEEMEKRLKEKLEWSERQKRREEEVKAARDRMREEETNRERDKLKQLRASLLISRGGTARVGKAGGGTFCGRARRR